MVASPAASVLSSAPQPVLADIFALVEDDLQHVNNLIPAHLSSDIALVEEIGHHIVNAGGKRLRPLLALLAARAAGLDSGDKHIRLATGIEFLHTATLLHDDVVDRSARRRGRATANVLWGNANSVLVGDFLYSRGFQLMVDIDRMDVMAIVSDAANLITEGEVMQLVNVGKLDITEDDYREVARRKTAMLFQAATHTGAVLGTDRPEVAAALRRYGLCFGMAYQLVDDWLDYGGDSDAMGKDAGDDLAEGKVTLPLIYTLAHGAPRDAEVIREAIQRRASEDFANVAQAVERSGGLDYVRRCAQVEADAAVSATGCLPPSEYREALAALAGAAVTRMA